MLINNWYAPLESENLTSEPMPVRMLGQDFVLFRDAEGEAHCLSDTCIHRGGSLCRGKTVNGTVECPYHGWRFDGTGQCTLIPSAGPDVAPPKRARVDSYPVEEKWGFVFVFLGDLPEDERPALPGDDYFPEWVAAEQGSKDYRFTRGQFLFTCNWIRALDNSLDPSHPFLVHSAFGNEQSPVVQPFAVDVNNQRTISAHTFRGLNEEGTWRSQIKDAPDDTVNQLQLWWGGLVLRNDLRPKPGVHHFVFSAYLPLDDHQTLALWLHGRNFFTESEHDADAVTRNIQVFEEDNAVISQVRPQLPPLRAGGELFVESDSHIAAFRKRVRDYVAKGWRIDTRALRDDDDLIGVIPSPARRADPNNWVYNSVPLKGDRRGSMVEAAE